MKTFQEYLEHSGEIGRVEGVTGAIIYVAGLPAVNVQEIVVFEGGGLGLVLSLLPTQIEVLQLSTDVVKVGTRVARTKRPLRVKVSPALVGRNMWIEREPEFFVFDEENDQESREVEGPRKPFYQRKRVEVPLETGVSIVDLIVPLGRGQRQLVIGDRKSGKTNFLLQTIQMQVAKGTMCIYVAIAKPQMEISRLAEFLLQPSMRANTILVASCSSDRAGLIYLTPYVAMTYAEYFRDQGKDVLIIFDDLTAHAKYYREIMLLAKRFPGRSSYPGDIFYIHSRLLERGGNFDKGSISCLPVAQSVMGDISGYIQSNIMSMTDGHIFFDADLFDQGRRPAINPFLSVTRVGEQTQTPLVREVSRNIRAFLSNYEKVKQFRHFQTELSENIRITFEKGERIVSFLDQLPMTVIDVQFNVLLYASIWSDFWEGIPTDQMKKEMNYLVEYYAKDADFRRFCDELVQNAKTFAELTQQFKLKDQMLMSALQPIRNVQA